MEDASNATVQLYKGLMTSPFMQSFLIMNLIALYGCA